MVYGFEEVIIPPVVVAFGAGLPQGSVRTSQLVAELLLVHPKVTEFMVPPEVSNADGFGQVGGGLQVTLAIHPGLLTEASLRNLKVKQPVASDEVNGPGMVVPQNPPASPPGTFPAALVLAI